MNKSTEKSDGTQRRQARRRINRKVLPDWIAKRLHTEGDHPRGAILQSAAELMAERSPSEVTLREIASHANVQYSLIHRHFGTKDKLIVELFQEFTEYGGQLMRSRGNIFEAIEETFTADSGGWARIFSWVALDGVPAESTFRDPTQMAFFQSMIHDAWVQRSEAHRRDEFDVRVVSSFLMLMISVWDLFAPYMQQVDNWRDRSLDDVKSEVLDLMQLLVTASAPLGAADDATQTRTSARAS